MTSRTFWSTDELPERDRFAYWREAHLWPLGIVAEPDPAGPAGFRAAMSTRSNGAVLHIRRVADAHHVRRGRREIARQPWNGYSVHLEAGEGTWLRRGGAEFVARAGDLIIADGDLPFEARSAGRYAHEVLLVPRALLRPHLPARNRSLTVLLSHRPGAEALAAGYFRNLVEQLDQLSAPGLDLALDTFCRLVGLACGSEAAMPPDAVHAARLRQAKQYIDTHLSDPGMSPAQVAAALGISVRSLHLLFEPTGTSFTRYVLRRRLDECRAALLGSTGAQRPVTDIALGWGFNSLPTFYRAFRREFGLTPSDVRDAAARC